MKAEKHLKRNIYKALRLPGVRPLETLFVFLFVSSFPAQSVPLEETTTSRTFADWCLNKTTESLEIRHTVDVLLQVAETQDCHQAEKLLSTRTELFLSNKQITDLRPLSGLTNLTFLFLDNNQITDLKPLSGLTNLIGFSLSKNQITDLKPLSGLTNLTQLWLDNNQITDLKPLSGLTNLTELSLGDAQTLTDKTCPIKPESICTF